MGSLAAAGPEHVDSRVRHFPGRIGVTIYEKEPLVRHGLRSMVNESTRTYVHREVAEVTTSVVIPPDGNTHINLLGPSATGRLSALAGPSVTPAVALITGRSFMEFNEVRRSGVRGLVLIDEISHELEYAIDAVAAGRSFLSAPFAGRILRWLFDRPVAGRDLRAGGTADLTDREHEVLVLLGRGHTNREIARALKIQDTTVRTHLCHILAKLNLRNRTAAVVYAIQSELYGCFM